MAEALYNKYRPQIFEDVVGQEHIERTLKNAIASDKISHAYLFTGPRGTGKTTTARLLSKALICEKGPTPDPDGSCEDCKQIAAGEHPDVYELDAASRTGVENVREEIIGKVNYAPTRGRYKVYIIDEVHMLSTAAFNALLKTLEEPPDHVVFVLCTTDPQKVPETILSRCQRFDFRRIASEELISRLGAICEMEGVRYEGDALDLIAHRAQGGMRDALTSLDQLIAFGEGEVTTTLAERLLGSLDSSDLADIVKSIGMRDAAACFRWTSEYMETGADLVQFVADLTSHMRDMYVMSLAGSDVALEVTESGRRELEVELGWYGTERLARMLAVLGDLANELKTSTNQRLSFEIALTRMVRPESDLTLAALAERIESLERALAGGAAPAVQPQAQAQAAAGAGAPANAEAVRPAATAHPVDQAPVQAHAAASAQPAQVDAGACAQLSASAADAAPQQEEPLQHADAAPAAQPAADARDASRLWSTVLAHLKKIGPAFGVIFMNTAPSVADGKLTIAFDPSSDFAFKAAQKQDARDALGKALERAGVAGMPYEIVKGEPGQVAAAAAQVDQPATSQQPAAAARQAQPVAAAQQPAARQDAAPAAGADAAPPWENVAADASHADQPAPDVRPAAPAASDDAAPTPGAIPPDTRSGSTPDVQEPTADPDFQDFLASAFGEGIVVEEIQE